MGMENLGKPSHIFLRPRRRANSLSAAYRTYEQVLGLLGSVIKMSSLRNAVPKRAYKERSQPQSRIKFGFLEKHKDYVIRAKEYHRKEDTLRKLKQKAANRNPDEFYFGMIKTKTVDGVHRPESVANKFTPEELMQLKTQDIGYVHQKIQSEKKKVEKLRAVLHSVDSQPTNKHIYYAENSEEANEIASSVNSREKHTLGSVPGVIKRKMGASYRQLEARMRRVEDLGKVYNEMALKKELQKKGRKRKLREDELVCPTSTPVYKWRSVRKR